MSSPTLTPTETRTPPAELDWRDSDEWISTATTWPRVNVDVEYLGTPDELPPEAWTP